MVYFSSRSSLQRIKEMVFIMSLIYVICWFQKFGSRIRNKVWFDGGTDYIFLPNQDMQQTVFNLADPADLQSMTY